MLLMMSNDDDHFISTHLTLWCLCPYTVDNPDDGDVTILITEWYIWSHSDIWQRFWWYSDIWGRWSFWSQWYMAMLSTLTNIFSCIAHIGSLHSQIWIAAFAINHSRSQNPPPQSAGVALSNQNPPHLQRRVPAKPSYKIFSVRIQCNGSSFSC